MATNLANFTPQTAWVNLLEDPAYEDLVGQKIEIQNVGGGFIKIWSGGSEEPTTPNSGYTLSLNEGWSGTTDSLWVRSATKTELAVGSVD